MGVGFFGIIFFQRPGVSKVKEWFWKCEQAAFCLFVVCGLLFVVHVLCVCCLMFAVCCFCCCLFVCLFVCLLTFALNKLVQKTRLARVGVANDKKLEQKVYTNSRIMSYVAEVLGVDVGVRCVSE